MVNFPIENILFACILASVFVSVRKWSFRCCLCDIWIHREWIFELGENKFERERETIIFSIRQYPLNSVIIFRKRHNIFERCFFQTRKHIEVGLNLSLAAGPKRCQKKRTTDRNPLTNNRNRIFTINVYVFMFFCVFFLLARYGRKTDWHILFRSMFSMFSMYLGMPKVAYRRGLRGLI